MSTMTRVHNPAPYELVVDTEGHVLPGRATMAADATDKVTGRLLDAKRLVIAPSPTPEPAAEPAPVVEDTRKKRQKPAPAEPAADGE
jgi:hypothetical protein